MIIKEIIKRDGRRVPYSADKISNAIQKAMLACGRDDLRECERLTHLVEAMPAWRSSIFFTAPTARRCAR